MKFLILVLMIFIIASLIIINNNDLYIYRSSDLEKFSEIYSGWLDGVYVNLQNLTGDVVRMKWIPE